MILVTGGTGLVGSHLLLDLALTNTKVRALYRTKSKLEEVKKIFSYYINNFETVFNKIEWVQADILDIPALELVFKDVDYVYHAAAFISFNPKDFDLLQKTNVEGTANIVNLCIAHGIKKLCYVSTIGTIGPSLPGKKATEENEWTGQNANVYALTKHAAEMEVWRGSQEKLDIVIVNPGVIIGPGFWQTGSGTLFKTVKKLKKHYPPGGSGFVSITDVTKVMIGLMQSSITGQRFILVSENLSFKDILSKLSSVMGKKPPTKKISFWQLKILRYLDFLSHLLTGNERRITSNTIYGLRHQEEYNCDKIKSSLQLEFEPLDRSILFSAEKFISEILEPS
jgi:nucleoside-diphosphate-sugar epimerase